MTTAISNFYTSVISAFTKREEIDYIGKDYLAGRVSYIIMEAILQYDLEVKNTENYFVWYSNGQGLNIRIWEKEDGYELKINNFSVHTEIPEDLLNDLIITELQIP